MTRIFAIFSVTAVASAAVVAAAATGAFNTEDSAANIARPRAVPSSPAGFGDDPRSAEELRGDALKALKDSRGQVPAEEPTFLQGPDIQPPVFADSPDAPPPAPVPAPTPELAPFVPAPALAQPSVFVAPEEAAAVAIEGQPKTGLSPQRIREIVDIRINNDPYRAPAGPSVQTDPFTGTTIINTSPNR